MLTDLDYQGFGVYDYGPPMGAFSIPSVADLVVVDKGLKVAAAEYRQAAMQLLNGTTLSISKQSPDEVHGQAAAIANMLGSGWATDYLNKGFAVLAKIATIESGSPTMLMTKSAATVATVASQAAGAYVVVDAPASVLAAARKGLQAKPPPGQPACPAGTTLTPTGCKPFPGGVEEEDSSLPTWALPALLGVGILAIGALYVSSQKKTSYTPNITRAKRYWQSSERQRAVR
jgi:hypothetical protein